MIEAGPRADERTVEVSPQALARIFPEGGPAAPGEPPTRAGRWGAARFRLRLLWTQARFRFDDFQAARTLATRLRLRGKLFWMRLRLRRKLPR